MRPRRIQVKSLCALCLRVTASSGAGRVRYSISIKHMTGEVTRAAVGSTGPTTTLIYDDWYPAIRASEIAWQADGEGHSAWHPAGVGTQVGREVLRHARPLSASRHSAFLRMVRRREGDLQVSRLGLRAGVRTVSRDSVAHQGRHTRSLPHLRDGLSVRGTRRTSLGLCPTEWERPNHGPP